MNLFDQIIGQQNIGTPGTFYGGSSFGNINTQDFQSKLPTIQKSIEAENNLKKQGYSDKEVKFLKLQKDKGVDMNQAFQFVDQKRQEVKQGPSLGVSGNVGNAIVGGVRVGEQIPRYAGNLLNLTQKYVTTPIIAGGAEMLGADQFAQKWRSAGEKFGVGSQALGEEITRAGEGNITENERTARRVGANIVATAPIPVKGLGLIKGSGILPTIGRGALAGAEATPISIGLEEGRLPTMGEQTIGTVGGAILGPVVEKVAIPGIQKAYEGVQKYVNPVKFTKQIDEDTIKLVRQAVRPSISGVDTATKFAVQDAKLLQGVKEVVKQGKAPKTAKELMQAIQETKQNIWSKVEQNNKAVVKTTTGDEIAIKLRQFVNNAENKTTFLSNPELKTKLLQYSDEVQANKDFSSISQQELQDVLTDINSRIPAGSFLKQLDANPTQTAQNTVIAKIYRDIIDDNLENAVGAAGKEARQAYGSVRQLEKDFAKRYGVYLRQNPKGLADMFGMEGFADIATGLLTSSPSQVLKGVAIQGAKKLIKNANNPDTIIRDIFNLQNKVKSTPNANISTIPSSVPSMANTTTTKANKGQTIAKKVTTPTNDKQQRLVTKPSTNSNSDIPTMVGANAVKKVEGQTIKKPIVTPNTIKNESVVPKKTVNNPIVKKSVDTKVENNKELDILSEKAKKYKNWDEFYDNEIKKYDGYAPEYRNPIIENWRNTILKDLQDGATKKGVTFSTNPILMESSLNSNKTLLGKYTEKQLQNMSVESKMKELLGDDYVELYKNEAFKNPYDRIKEFFNQSKSLTPQSNAKLTRGKKLILKSGKNGTNDNNTSNSGNPSMVAKPKQLTKGPRLVEKPKKVTTPTNEQSVSNTQSSTNSNSDIPEGYTKNAFGEVIKKPSNSNGGFIRNPFAKPEPKRLFAGENSAQPPKGKTGWFKGADGKMRFEIDDSGAKFIDNAIVNKNGKALLGDIFRHDELFNQYPELKSIIVKFNDTVEKGGGSYNPSTRTLTINGLELDPRTGEFLGGTKEAKSTLLHEIQHSIQEKEGFARGGSANESSLKAAEKYWYNNDKTFKEIADTYNKINQDHIEGKINSTERMMKRLSLEKKYEKEIKDFTIGEYEAYKRLAGEVEARNVQTRMNMTKAERAKTSPIITEERDVPRAKQIIRMDSKGPSMSIKVPGSKQPVSEKLVEEAIPKSKTAKELEGKVFYTGQKSDWTPKKLREYNPTTDDSLMYGPGLYLTPDISIAQGYAQGGGKVHGVMPEIKNPLTPSMKDWLTFIQKGNGKMKQDFLIRKGYDAVVDLKGKYKQIMIVDPTQVKKIK